MFMALSGYGVYKPNIACEKKTKMLFLVIGAIKNNIMFFEACFWENGSNKFCVSISFCNEIEVFGEVKH